MHGSMSSEDQPGAEGAAGARESRSDETRGWQFASTSFDDQDVQARGRCAIGIRIGGIAPAHALSRGVDGQLLATIDRVVSVVLDGGGDGRRRGWRRRVDR